MTKEQLWAKYAAKYPSFGGDEDVKLTAKGLRRLFDVTWEHAYKEGWGNGRRAQTPPTTDVTKEYGMPDFFGGIFK